MRPMRTINIADWTVLGLYGAVLASIALYHSRKMLAQDDFYLASRSMRRWPIALSMYVAVFSTNSFLGVTGWVNRPNGTVWIGLIQVGVILAVPLVIALYPSIFFRLRITTAYEYLERRFNYLVRAFAAQLFLGARIMWLSTMIYAASLVASRMAGLAQVHAILLVGGMGTFLSMAGGMHAVIWTDVLQFFVLFIGVAVMVTVAVGQSGGLAEAIRTGLDAGKFAPPMVFSLTEELTIASALMLGIFGYLGTAGADQVVLQTYLSAKSESEAKKSLLRNGMFLKPLSLIFPMLGWLLFVYFRKHPESAAYMRIPDDAVPVFVTQVMPSGARGLVIAAILSAVLTGVESGLSALSACVQVDYVRRLRRQPLSNRDSVVLARALVLGWGIAATTGALFVRTMGAKSNILQILNRVMYPLSGVLLGIFLLGLLTRRANAPGALIGAAAGFIVTIAGPMSQWILAVSGGAPAALVAALRQLGRVSSFYYASLGALSTFVFGYLASIPFASPGSHQLIGLSHAAPRVAAVVKQ